MRTRPNITLYVPCLSRSVLFTQSSCSQRFIVSRKTILHILDTSFQTETMEDVYM